MGYDLHLTRADNWFEAEESPISVDEWAQHARTRGLTETTELDEGTPAPVFLLGVVPAVSPALYWIDGRVVVRGANEEHVASLTALARDLGVNLVGDDGEHY